MLRRISVIAASAAMLALSALPAYAAPHSSTHKLSFPSLRGVQAWGTYKMTRSGVKVYVCAKDTGNYFAVGAVTLESNSGNTLTANLGAVAIGPGQTVCRGPATIHYTGHMRIYTFIAGSSGKITHRSKTKTVY
jgi:hypothetical protein